MHTPARVLLAALAISLICPGSAPATTPPPGDSNEDFRVGLIDLDTLARYWGAKVGDPCCGPSVGDFNGDGDTNILDLDILSGGFTVYPPPAAAPEPYRELEGTVRLFMKEQLVTNISLEDVLIDIFHVSIRNPNAGDIRTMQFSFSGPWLDSLYTFSDTTYLPRFPSGNPVLTLADSFFVAPGDAAAAYAVSNENELLAAAYYALTDDLLGTLVLLPGNATEIVAVLSVPSGSGFDISAFEGQAVIDGQLIPVEFDDVPLVYGDTNADGSVDLIDLDLLSGNFGIYGGGPCCGPSGGDFNWDGNIDILDLDILSYNFGFTWAPPSAPIPEPTAAIVMALCLALAATRRRP